jgi:lipoate-protein ligase B
VSKPGVAIDLGRRDFREAWELQLRLVARRQANEIPDTLLLVEHDDVITLGRRAGARAHVLDERMPIYEIERGGDVTYHGPGQLVGYPIVRLDEEERDLHAYLRALEEGLIRACAEFGVAAGRNPGLTGVWSGGRKLGSIGIAVRRWVTLHGFALNVSTDLGRFAAIHPCGLDAAVMTSLSQVAGHAIGVGEVAPRVAGRVGEALGRRFEPAAPSAVGE